MSEHNPPFDKTSKDWPKLKLWLETEIAEASRQLEQVGWPEAQTNALRGRISAYRDLTESVEPSLFAPPKPASYT